jgi:hypothetical protein
VRSRKRQTRTKIKKRKNLSVAFWSAIRRFIDASSDEGSGAKSDVQWVFYISVTAQFAQGITPPGAGLLLVSPLGIPAETPETQELRPFAYLDRTEGV